MRIIQAYLKASGGETITAWLDVRPGLKVGATVTLKDFKPGKQWRVEQLFEPEHDAPIEFELGYNPLVNDFCRAWE